VGRERDGTWSGWGAESLIFVSAGGCVDRRLYKFGS
jgi:hypothetical protein